MFQSRLKAGMIDMAGIDKSLPRWLGCGGCLKSVNMNNKYRLLKHFVNDPTHPLQMFIPKVGTSGAQNHVVICPRARGRIDIVHVTMRNFVL